MNEHMKGKQALIDAGVVLALLVLLMGGYYAWSPEKNQTLLSFTTPNEGRQEYGKKARGALAALKSISMDSSLFENPVYRSLDEFHVDIPASSLGRSYPFTPPDSLRLRKTIQTR